MSVTYTDLLMGVSISDVPVSHQISLDILLKKINIVKDAYGKPMKVTSGYRTMQDHLRIYSKKGITDKSKIPMKSQHLLGLAVDISDPKGELHKWVKEHPEVLEQADMYCELGTIGWVHFQCNPFKSYKPGGSRWFNP